MRSNLMAGLGVGMLLVVVFGITFIAQYTGGTEKESAKPLEEAGITGVPLLFTKNEMGYDPASEDLDKKYFQGFFEVTDQLHKVNFWFKNPHPQAVTFTVRGRSCTACTSANVAVVAPEAVKQFESQTAFGAQAAMTRLGVGAAPAAGLVASVAHLALVNSLKWQALDFENPDAGVTVPAAPDADTPTWGVFQMVVKVTGIGAKQLRAEVGMAVGKSPTVRQIFGVTVIGASVFDVSPRKIELGDFPEGAAPRVSEIVYLSATRDQSELPAPVISVSAPDDFLRLGAPIPLTALEMEYLSSGKSGGPSRVKGGYRIPVTVYRKLPAAQAGSAAATQLDVGPYERQIGITGVGTASSVAVAVTANVTGVLSLRDGGVIDLRDFNGRSGVERSVVVVTDRADLALELLPDECFPKFVKVSLGAPSEVGGRREWTIKLVVPPDACQADLPPDSAVVLRGKSGGETVKVKLVMKGRGFVRGR